MTFVLNAQGDSLMLRVDTGIETLKRLNAPTLSAMVQLGRVRLANQSQVRKAVNVGGATATGEASTADVTTEAKDTVVSATYDLATNRLRSSFFVPAAQYATARNAAAMGQDSDLYDLIGYYSKGAIREIMNAVGANIFTGTGNAASGGIVGFDAQVATAASGKSTVTYAGLNPATYALWTSLVGTGAAMTRDLIRDFIRDMESGETVGTPSGFNVAVAHPDVIGWMENVFDQQFTINAGYRDSKDIGYTSMTLNGNPVISDPNATDDSLYLLDVSGVEVAFLDVETPENLYGAERALGDHGIPVYVQQLATTNPELVRFAAYTKAQLVVADRTKVAIMKDIEAPAPYCLPLCE
jgi:hypothetical protein